jgi:peptidoglycan/LPS O-acetylase OafA/YrhL
MVKHLDPLTGLRGVAAGIIVGLTTVAAYASYRLIEVPSRRWIRKVVIGRARAVMPAN